MDALFERNDANVTAGLDEFNPAPAMRRPSEAGAGASVSDAFAWAREAPLLLASLFLLWVVCNPYFATDRGAAVYLGRALADLDPSGVGRDMMFRLDGQSGFTLFTPAYRAITGLFGPAGATALVAGAAMLASFVAACVFAASVSSGRTRALVVAFLAAMPAYYGDGYQLFAYAEAAATPRPFAEALVLFGLSALLRRRKALAFTLIALACLIHPIMALAGVATAFIYLVLERRSVLWLAAGGALLAYVASRAGVPLFDRALQTMDPEWRATLELRVPFLFPLHWSDVWVGRTAARAAGILIALRFAPKPVARLFLAALAAGLIGTAVAALGDKYSLLLILQAQTWRMIWMTCAAGFAASAISIAALWPRGGTDRVGALLLALALISSEHAGPALLFSVCALIAVYSLGPDAIVLPRRAEKILVGLLLIVVALGLAANELPLLRHMLAAPQGDAFDAVRTLGLAPNFFPFAALACLLGLKWRQTPAMEKVWLVVVATIAPLALWQWDQRSAEAKYFDSGEGAPALAATLAERPGEIYWIDGRREVWQWLHRPNWLIQLQGAGAVFSRELAVAYRARSDAAIADGLAEETVIAPNRRQNACAQLKPTAAAIARFCARPGAPAWIVAPLDDDGEAPVGVAAKVWTAPFDKLTACPSRTDYVWRRSRRYALIPCAAPAP